MKDIGHPFVAYPALYTREPLPANGTKVSLKAYTGYEISCHKNQTHDF